MKPLIATILATACAPACEFDPRGTLAGTPEDPDAGEVTPDAEPPASVIDRLLARVAACDAPLGGLFAHDLGGDARAVVCGVPGAVFWKADLDVNCDGQISDVCNWDTDPWFEDWTSATTSLGDPLDAATLPFVVVPAPSDRWDPAGDGVELGTVVAVIYGGRLEFGVFGDEGHDEIIGEASYRMAELLGIDPDPAQGGAADGAVYLAFPGASGRVQVIEDHAEAVAVGEARVADLLAAP